MAEVGLLQRRAFETARRDVWWAQPLVTFVVFAGFVVYATWAAFQGTYYHHGPYLSPLYSPEVFGDGGTSWFGPQAGLVAGVDAVVAGASSSSGLPAASGSPATTTGAPTTRRSGPIRRPARWGSRARRTAARRSFPLIIQNVHRYFLYLALVFLVVLCPRRLEGALVHRSGHRRGLLRHRRGDPGARRQRRPARRLHPRLPLAAAPGRRDGSTSSPALRRGRRVRLLELPQPAAHALGLAVSLFWVAFADLYVRLCSMGIWTDWRIF